MKQGFTIIELVVSVAIISVLSMIVLFSISQYVNKGKDSNVYGNLAVLIPAGEAYYNVENAANGDGYTGFCTAPSVDNIFEQLTVPNPPLVCDNDPDHPGLCCAVAGEGDEWAVCAQEFTNALYAFCVDSRGVKKHLCSSSCVDGLTQCPTDDLSLCE